MIFNEEIKLKVHANQLRSNGEKYSRPELILFTYLV